MYILPEEKLELTDEIKNEILSLSTHKRKPENVLEQYGKYLHEFEDIFSNSTNPFGEIFYILKNGRQKPCRYNNITKFSSKNKYYRFCDTISKCKCKSEHYNDANLKAQETNIEKYGTYTPLLSPEVQEKIKNTNLEKYGNENIFATSYGKEKIKKSNLEKYGVVNPMQIDNVKNSTKQTNLEKYGYESPLSCQSVINKRKLTNLERYGVEHNWSSSEVRKKIEKTNLERYGVPHPMKSQEIKDRLRSTVYNIYGVPTIFKSKQVQKACKNTIKNNYGVEYVFSCSEFRSNVKKLTFDKYGVEYATQKNFTNIGKKVINDPELFQEYLDKYTVYELQEIFGFKYTAIYEYVKKFNLTIPIRTGSSYENILSEILTENGIDHVRQDRSIIPPKEIDIYIPSANLAIEINGLYWHSDKFKDKNYHYSKWKECHDNGIQLLSIMEDEFVNRSNTWISKILHICNKSKERIHARKCDIVELGKDGVYDFVEKYHLQGFSLAKHYYGAYYDNELVAMMSFTNTRNNKEIQMNRFCLKNGVVISGIANRLLKAYITDYDINEIVTYSDNRYSDGGIYRQMGFEMVNTMPPDYSYVKGMERFHKSGFKKSNIATKFGMDMSNKTEREAMEELGFVRIYDCGKVKWKFVKKSG